MGIITDGAGIKSHLIGKHTHFGDIYICPSATTNTLCAALIDDEQDLVKIGKLPRNRT